MTTKEYPQVPPSEPQRKTRRILPYIVTSALTAVGVGTAYNMFAADEKAMPDTNPTVTPWEGKGGPIQIFPPEKTCDTERTPLEGSFNKNSGIQRLPATVQRQSVAVVTPDRSLKQQAELKLTDTAKMDWINVNPGQNVGIVVRTEVDILLDTTADRGVWYKACGVDKDAVDQEIPTRVQDVFTRFGFDQVVVYMINGKGYGVQVVPKGQKYSASIPSKYTPF